MVVEACNYMSEATLCHTVIIGIKKRLECLYIYRCCSFQLWGHLDQAAKQQRSVLINTTAMFSSCSRNTSITFTAPNQSQRGQRGLQTLMQVLTGQQDFVIKSKTCSASSVYLRVENWPKRPSRSWGGHAVDCQMLSHLEIQFAGRKETSVTGRLTILLDSSKLSTNQHHSWAFCWNLVL